MELSVSRGISWKHLYDFANTRRKGATGHASLREGGARPWMGYGCMGKYKWQGPRRGEYGGRPLRKARLHTSNGRIQPFADGPCGSMHRRRPAVLPPPPFPFARKGQPQRVPPTGRHPPLGGGRMLALAPYSESPRYHTFIIHLHSNPRRTELSGENRAIPCRALSPAGSDLRAGRAAGWPMTGRPEVVPLFLEPVLD